ncbi:MAG TPA: DUF190 domain-containing protein [Blastocatellia bacterium]|nr:DUF190 domain-containing protein [Blastocatellia bacterium]
MNEQPAMANQTELVPAARLRVFITEEDAAHHQALWQTILRLLKDAGVAGATVFRGTEGFGESRVIHTARLEIMSCNLPIIIEAVDAPERIEAVTPRLSALVASGLIEISRTFIVRPGAAAAGTLSEEKSC